MRNRHPQHQHSGQAKVDKTQYNTFEHGYGVVRARLGRIRNMAARPELRTRHKDEEEQPDGKVAVEPRPDFESEQAQEADDPDSAIYRGKNTPAVERHYRYQIEQVDEKAEVGQWRPDRMHTRRQLCQKQADRRGYRARNRPGDTHLCLIFGNLADDLVGM